MTRSYLSRYVKYTYIIARKSDERITDVERPRPFRCFLRRPLYKMWRIELWRTRNRLWASMGFLKECCSGQWPVPIIRRRWLSTAFFSAQPPHLYPRSCWFLSLSTFPILGRRLWNGTLKLSEKRLAAGQMRYAIAKHVL